MLVLTRKQSQMIQIGDNIIVKVIQTGKGTVKIGIEAPTDVRIVRGEILNPESNSDESSVMVAPAELAAPNKTESDKPQKLSRGPLTRSVA